MQTVTLRGSNFTTVHNALCDLRQMAAKDDKLQSLVKKFEEGLRDCYDQDTEMFNKKFDHFRDIQFANGFETVWSIYELSDLTLPAGYGEDPVVEYQGFRVKVKGKTWIDIWRACDTAIYESGDNHHIFIERIYKDGDVLKVVTGS